MKIFIVTFVAQFWKFIIKFISENFDSKLFSGHEICIKLFHAEFLKISNEIFKVHKWFLKT